MITIHIRGDAVGENEILRHYQQYYKTKICKEKLFLSTLREDEIKVYTNFLRKGCCIYHNTLNLVIYCYCIAIFTIVGLFFCISKNEGYKAYKGLLERNLSEINIEFPNENETLKLVSYLNRNKSLDNNCTYIRYSVGKCDLNNYRSFCSDDYYKNNICNYMDHEYYLGNSFICDKDNYDSGKCEQIQYFDYLNRTANISYEQKIEYNQDIINISIYGYTYEKLWCKIGDYDFPIYLSFLIILIIFIVALTLDLICTKKAFGPGVKYYMIITYYLFFYFVVRIYIILFLILTIYSFIVLLSFPTTQKNYLLEFYNEEEKLWEKKIVFAIIFDAITLVIFFMIIFLAFYKKKICDFFLFKFEGNNNCQILRNASLKVGNKKYNFKLYKIKIYICMKSKPFQKCLTKRKQYLFSKKSHLIIIPTI